MGAPPGISHGGKNAMLPTKASFEDVGLKLPCEEVTTGSGSRSGRAADGSYASTVGSPIGDCEVDVRDGKGMEVGRGGCFLLLLFLLCSCRIGLARKA